MLLYKKLLLMTFGTTYVHRLNESNQTEVLWSCWCFVSESCY